MKSDYKVVALEICIGQTQNDIDCEHPGPRVPRSWLARWTVATRASPSSLWSWDRTCPSLLTWRAYSMERYLRTRGVTLSAPLCGPRSPVRHPLHSHVRMAQRLSSTARICSSYITSRSTIAFRQTTSGGRHLLRYSRFMHFAYAGAMSRTILCSCSLCIGEGPFECRPSQ